MLQVVDIPDAAGCLQYQFRLKHLFIALKEVLKVDDDGNVLAKDVLLANPINFQVIGHLMMSCISEAD